MTTPQGNSGHENAFERLYESTFSDVTVYCRRHTYGKEDAQDAVAEVYVVAWRKIEDALTAANPTAWLIAIARNTILNQKRTVRRQTLLFERLTKMPCHPGVDSAQQALSAQAVESIVRSLNKLPLIDQELVLLVAARGLTYKEIAVIVDKSPAVVRSRLYRARNRLRQDLRYPAR